MRSDAISRGELAAVDRHAAPILVLVRPRKHRYRAAADGDRIGNATMRTVAPPCDPAGEEHVEFHPFEARR